MAGEPARVRITLDRSVLALLADRGSFSETLTRAVGMIGLTGSAASQPLHWPEHQLADGGGPSVERAFGAAPDLGFFARM